MYICESTTAPKCTLHAMHAASSWHLDSCLGMLTGGVPFLLAELQQLLELLLHVPVCLTQLGHPLKLSHLSHPAPRSQGAQQH